MNALLHLLLGEVERVYPVLNVLYRNGHQEGQFLDVADKLFGVGAHILVVGHGGVLGVELNLLLVHAGHGLTYQVFRWQPDAVVHHRRINLSAHAHLVLALKVGVAVQVEYNLAFFGLLVVL